MPRGEPSAFADETAADGAKYREAQGNTDGNGKSTHKFTLTRFRDIKLGTEPAYLVQGLIPREGLMPTCPSPSARSARNG